MLSNKVNYPDYFNGITEPTTLPDMLKDIREQGYDIEMINLRRRAQDYRRQGYCKIVGKEKNRNLYLTIKEIPDFYQSTSNAFDYLAFFKRHLLEPKTINEILDDIGMEGYFPCRDSVAKSLRGYYEKATLVRYAVRTDDNLPAYMYQLREAATDYTPPDNPHNKPERLHTKAWYAINNKKE